MQKRRLFVSEHRILRTIVLAVTFGLLVMSQSIAASGLTTNDLNGGLMPQNLAQSLVGNGVAISNVKYTGANGAAGNFTGGAGIIGFNDGIILSSGAISNVIGPNDDTGVTRSWGLPGDTDLTNLSGQPTYDAAVLEFDFVPNNDKLYMKYVFSSDEYNEYVNQYNDVFAFFVNGVNYATVNGSAVSVDTINKNVNSNLYIDNDFQNGSAPLNTQMDGLTKVLTLKAPIKPGQVNHMRLAIADARDSLLDANVFLQTGSLMANTSKTSFKVSVSPKVVKKGKAVIFKGQLKDSSGQGLANSTAIIQKKVVKKVKKKIKGKIKFVKKVIWKNVKTTTTDENGFFSTKLKPKETSIFRGKFAGDSDDKAANSNTVKVIVKKKKR